MLARDFSDIRFGEVVIFGDDECQARLCDGAISNEYNFAIRRVTTDDRQLLAVARRPLVLTPEREAYVAQSVDSHFCDLRPLFEKLYDCAVDDAPEFEIVYAPTNAFCFLRTAYHDAAPCGAMDESIDESEEAKAEEKIEFDRKKWMDRLSALVLEYVAANKEMPSEEIINTVIRGKLQISRDNKLSPVVVNKNMKIILPAYNEVELRMTPLARTIYILFLCHPEGIVLKEIGDYRDELTDIYTLVKPRAKWELAESSINELATPGSDLLQQQLSRIKRAVTNQILVKELSEPYIISGKRGGEYRLNIPPDMITLPRALRR